MSSRSDAARRANETRRYRRKFAESYPGTWRVVRALSDKRFEDELAGYTKSTVAAVKANLKRWGVYSQMAADCNW